MCELEPDCRRAPRASLEAQRFRYLQKVNDLEISTPDGEIWPLCDPQYAELRAKLIGFLDTHAEVEFKSLRSKLGLKKPKGSETDYPFNLEAGGEKKIKGNATTRKLSRCWEKTSTPSCRPNSWRRSSTIYWPTRSRKHWPGGYRRGTASRRRRPRVCPT